MVGRRPLRFTFPKEFFFVTILLFDIQQYNIIFYIDNVPEMRIGIWVYGEMELNKSVNNLR